MTAIATIATALQHPLPSGLVLSSPGANYSVRILGPCCRLFDREELPWPCCRLQWRGKEPSWRRIGRRLVPDLATMQSPSYSVEIVEPGYLSPPQVMTFYAQRLNPSLREWWFSRKLLSSGHEAPPLAPAEGEAAVGAST